MRQEGSYVYEDEELAAKFEKDAGTVQSTRNLIADMIGNKPIHQVTDEDWTAFNNMLFKLPSNHGKSPLDKEQHCFEIIDREKNKKARELRKAEIKIKKERVGKDESEALREKARFKKNRTPHCATPPGEFEIRVEPRREVQGDFPQFLQGICTERKGDRRTEECPTGNIPHAVAGRIQGASGQG